MTRGETKTIVITGATRGLGRALVDALIPLGHVIAGCGRSKRDIAELAAAYPPPHLFTTLSVADDDAVGAWARELLDRVGAPDLLVNNAALINQTAPLWEVPSREFSELIDVNVKGTVNVIRHLAPAMIARRSGVVVNLSSGWGRSTSPGVAPYCASKWAIEGLTRSFAQDLPPGLAAIALNPGVIHTDMLDVCFGRSAASHPEPAVWAKRAVPFLLALGASDNGKSLSIPSR